MEECAMHVDEAIHARRTHKRFGGELVSRETVEELLELARWAPNHRHTYPWRFCVLLRDGIDRLEEFARRNTAEIAGDPKKVKKVQGKIEELLGGAGAIVIVTQQVDKDPEIAREDYATCACACQNILLGATARGIASFWSTGTLLCSPKTKEFYGLGPKQEIVGALVLGSPIAEGKPKRDELGDRVRWL
jgi:nitroreductase